MVRTLTAAIALVAFGGIASAQTTAPTPTTNPPTAPATTTAPGTSTAPAMTAPMNSTGSMSNAASMDHSTMSGMKMADSATVALKFVAISPADIMSSKLIGVNVYNNKQESLGEIEDLALENGKTIKGVVVSVGGFLGMGESYVLVDPSTIVLNQKDGTWRAYVDTNKDSLKNAPKFQYSKKK